MGERADLGGGELELLGRRGRRLARLGQSHCGFLPSLLNQYSAGPSNLANRTIGKRRPRGQAPPKRTDGSIFSPSPPKYPPASRRSSPRPIPPPRGRRRRRRRTSGTEFQLQRGSRSPSRRVRLAIPA